MSNDAQRKRALDMLLPLSLEQQLRRMTNLGTYLTISARDSYPFQESQGDIARLVGFNELLHQVFGRIRSLSCGHEWTLESFLDVLQQKSIHYGIERNLSRAMENSFRGLATGPGKGVMISRLLRQPR
jgi:hypothetical protein